MRLSHLLAPVSRALFLLGVAFLASCAAYSPAKVTGEKVHRNLTFAQTPQKDLRLDLYVPPSDHPVPVVVWIFGGSWKLGSKGFHVNVRDLTKHGIAVASIQYRYSQEAVYPAQLEDCNAAVQWLRKHGASYGLDTQKIGLSGESAGGHLAALVGIKTGRPEVKAVCALYPPTDLVKLGRKFAKPGKLSDVDKLLGGPVDSRLALARDASPALQVTAKAPPFLIYHANGDPLVPLDQSQMLDHRLRQAGVESLLIVVHQDRHWFTMNAAQTAEVAEFFHRHFSRKASR
ncbi:MAG: alpha/beta hydrolase fold domain-containing protein [Verrucomicrobium sp.]